MAVDFFSLAICGVGTKPSTCERCRDRNNVEWRRSMAAVFNVPGGVVDWECNLRPWTNTATSSMSLSSQIDAVALTLQPPVVKTNINDEEVKRIAMETNDPKLIAKVVEINSAIASKACSCTIKPKYTALKNELKKLGLIA